MALERSALLADDALTGAAWCTAHSDLVDDWLGALFGGAVTDASGLCLVATGGYGRAELCPKSDIDVMLVHDGRRDVGDVANRIWYPVWDEGLKLGHSVSTVREALALAADDLDTATALLSIRAVAGDGRMAEALAAGARAQWERRRDRFLAQLATRVEQRHEVAGEVAFLLEPDLKDGRGGLRDVHSLRWASLAHDVMLDLDVVSVDAAYATLLDARVALQRTTGRATNVLTLQDQDAVAVALGDADADVLMGRISSAARAIAWTSDDAWRRYRASRTSGRSLGRRRRVTWLDHGVGVIGDTVVVADDATIAGDPLVVLRVGAVAAASGAVIERASLERLAALPPALPEPWPDDARRLFVELLSAGPPAISVIESLDQRGVWGRLLPEWDRVRSRPQRNAYHRFTVDRHLLEAVGHAAPLAGRVARPDLLLVAALLHDIGKGAGGDHVADGVVIVRTVATRMGFEAGDVETLCSLVELHLLLPDVATRRDLDDPSTSARVAELVGVRDRLELLAALAEADSQATGPSAWGPWKASLLGRLVDQVGALLDGGDVAASQFPSPGQLERLAQPGRHLDGHGDVLTVMTDDRPGVFSRAAGVLAMHGLDVLAAAAHSTDDGRALAEFKVADPFRSEPPWPKVLADLELALDGRLAVDARVADRARRYGRRTAVPVAPPVVHVDVDASPTATVIDVHAPDGVGVLHRITRALAELDLDIRSAKVETMGEQVVDAFYVRDRQGRKVVDRHHLDEIERAILHSLG